MKKTRFLTLVLALGLLLASCEKEVPTAPLKAGSVANFPNSIGSSWTYYVKDNLQDTGIIKPDPIIDTIPVAIQRISTDPQTGLKATVWLYQFKVGPKEKLVVIRPDTVYIYWNQLTGDKISLAFPFDYRDSWQSGGLISGDKTTCIDTVSMNLAAGNFKKVYVLENERKTTVSTDKRIITLWFVPDFGFIKINVHEEHALTVGDTSWTLSAHNNPNF